MKADKLNIRSDSTDWRGAILSNLANTPFRIGKIVFPSVESALQGIKLADEKERMKIFAMSGIEALRTVRKIMENVKADETTYVYWDGKKMVYNSIEHRLLLAMFIGEKVRQNPMVQEALLETQDVFIYHDVGIENPTTSLPEKFYIQILLSQRDLLERLRKIA